MPEGFKGVQANSGAMICRVISPLQGQMRQIAKGPRMIQETSVMNVSTGIQEQEEMLPRIRIPSPDPWARYRDQPPYSSLRWSFPLLMTGLFYCAIRLGNGFWLLLALNTYMGDDSETWRDVIEKDGMFNLKIFNSHLENFDSIPRDAGDIESKWTIFHLH